jgi:TonB family protein
VRRTAGLRRRIPLCLAVSAAALVVSAANAETTAAVQTKYVKAAYPDNLSKTQVQGNVLLVGRIDTRGRITGLQAIATSHKDFVAPALEAVKQWEFRPATREGKPVEIFANVGVRFRITSEKRGEIPAPILGDVSISPADASGKATAPEGFPIRRGEDPALRAEALLDLPPRTQDRTLTVRVEAISPRGRRIPVFQPPVAVPAKATEVRIPVVARIDDDWEDGVWMLRFTVDKGSAGGGQFWLAADPAHFSFVIPKP